jgi:hypothetical protein
MRAMPRQRRTNNQFSLRRAGLACLKLYKFEHFPIQFAATIPLWSCCARFFDDSEGPNQEPTSLTGDMSPETHPKIGPRMN